MATTTPKYCGIGEPLKTRDSWKATPTPLRTVRRSLYADWVTTHRTQQLQSRCGAVHTHRHLPKRLGLLKDDSVPLHCQLEELPGFIGVFPLAAVTDWVRRNRSNQRSVVVCPLASAGVALLRPTERRTDCTCCPFISLFVQPAAISKPQD